MPQVIVAGTLDFAGDSDCADIIRGAAGPIAESRAEDGCIAYDWAVDPLVPGRVQVFEAWESEAALGAHFRHTSYQAMVDHLNAQTLAGFDVKLYSVAGNETVFTDSGERRDTIFGVKIA
jgi:quinol monooxygenase YgiN